jgi:hypothetical protein
VRRSLVRHSVDAAPIFSDLLKAAPMTRQQVRFDAVR